jgi:hypothetical protein
MIPFGHRYKLQDPYDISYHGIMHARLFQQWQNLLKIGSDQFGMIAYTITHGPGRSLGNPVFALQKKVHQRRKFFLVIAYIPHYLIALFFRMFFFEGF